MNATFVGANIKGTPSMPAAAVRHDLKVLKQHGDIVGLQEFKWPWYWRVLAAVLVGWGSFPGHAKATKNPSDAAQGILWKRSMFTIVRRFSRPAFNFGRDNGGIMDNRFIRAALLRAKQDGFTAWFLSTHFVVGGDSKDDSARRQVFMRDNLKALDEALAHLTDTGYPIMGELDANIRKNTWSHHEMLRILRKHGATIHGEQGIEFAFSINGPKGRFNRVKATVIPDGKLKTDHEARVLNWTGTNTKGSA